MLTPKDYIGPIMELAQDRRGEFKEMNFITESRAKIIYELPLAEVWCHTFHTRKKITWFSTPFVSCELELLFLPWIKEKLVEVKFLNASARYTKDMRNSRYRYRLSDILLLHKYDYTKCIIGSLHSAATWYCITCITTFQVIMLYLLLLPCKLDYLTGIVGLIDEGAYYTHI